jgi:gliding motility-associated-like protein
VILTSSAICAAPVSDTSNSIIAVINPMLQPSVLITANPPGVFCDGTTITYSAVGLNGGLLPDYQWLINGTATGSNNDTLVSSLFEDGDTLSLIFTSSETCLLMNPVTSNEIIIERLPPLQPLATGPVSVCKGEEVHISASVTGGNGGPYYYSWDNGLGSLSDYTFIPQSTGIYTVTVSDSCSTPRSASVTVIVNLLPEPEFSFLPVTTDILNPNLEFKDLSVNASAWQWQFGDLTGSQQQNPTHTYIAPGYYTVGLIVTSAEGCTDSIYHELYIANVVTYYIPNSFTPNGDGKNDYFGVTGYSVSGYEMVIYSRWGDEIFKSTGSKILWDGSDSSGNPVQSGVYVYKIKVLNDPQKRLNTGTVTLIR